MRFRAPVVLLASIAVAVLVGCTQSNTPRLPDADFFVGQGNPFLLRLGETVGVQTPSAIVVVALSDVLADNRCPETVQCIDAGAVTIRLAVQSALSLQQVDIEVPPGGDVEVVVEELTVRVFNVFPAAMEGVTIDIVDYEIGLNIIQTTDLTNL